MAINIFDPAFDIPHPVNVFPPAFDLTGVLPPAAIERYFTELASAGSQYYTIPTVTLAGDFEIEFDVYAAGSNFGRVLSGSGPSTINYEGNNFIGFRSAGNSFTVSSATITRNQLTHVTVTRSGSDVNITSSNGTSGLLTGKSGDFVVEQITGNASGAGSDGYMDGIIANVRIKDNGVLVRSYDIDETWVSSNVLVNDAVVLEANQVSIAGLLAGKSAGAAATMGIEDPKGGSEAVRVDFATSGDFIRELITPIANGLVRLYIKPHSGVYTIGAKSDAPGITHTLVEGWNLVEFVGLANRLQIGNVQGVFDIYAPSVQSADGYGTAVNLTSTDAQNYVFNGNVSPNTWTGDDTTVIEVAGT